MSTPQREIQRLRRKLLGLYDGEKRQKIAQALTLSRKLCKGQIRGNGDPAFIHPLFVAVKTAEMGLGVNSICAALLHDVFEDHPDNESLEPIILEQFGKDVLRIIKSLTVLQTPQLSTERQEKIEATRKFLVATAGDLRVIMIKLATKLHNLVTVEGIKPEFRQTFFKQIERIYIPLSEFLDIHQLSRELRDVYLLKTNPKEYLRIERFVNAQPHFNDKTVEKIKKELETALAKAHIKAKVTGRVKGVASIYKKQQRLKNTGRPSRITDLKDILALRIITRTKDECFKIAEMINGNYTTFPDEFDDYISNPDTNGYQSLHITINHERYGSVEIQIRTLQMHIYAEFGPAAHFAYKESDTRQADPTSRHIWTKDIAISNYYPALRDDRPIRPRVFSNRIFVITPKQMVLELPKNSTPVDFAFALHTEIGIKCAGATVNGRSKPLLHHLKTGDVVEIITDETQDKPNTKWLDFVLSEKAKYEIRKALE